MAYQSEVVQQIASPIVIPSSFAEDRSRGWMQVLGLKGGAVGQFNFWEDDVYGTITWAYSSADWFAVVRGAKPISSLNLINRRTESHLESCLLSWGVLNCIPKNYTNLSNPVLY